MQGSTQGRPADVRFDAFRLAGSAGQVSGRLDPATLERLADRVFVPGASVDWTIRGTTDEQGRPAIRVSIAGTVPLTCQRCLGVVTWPVEQSTLLLLARDEAEMVRLDEASEHEVTTARDPLAAVTLVEDELLLTLPFAPRHEDGCPPP